MQSFYIELNGFGKCEIINAAGKTFKFTELICDKASDCGFLLQISIEKKRPDSRRARSTPAIISLSTKNHALYAGKKTHFSFEPHGPLSISGGFRLFVQLIPGGVIEEFKSKLHCDLL
jgi:hypothetical protein